MNEFLFKSEIDLVDKNNCRYSINKLGSIILGLPDGSRRAIGRLTETIRDNKRILSYFCHRKEKVHLMRVNNSYGINEFIINTFKPDEIVFHIEDTGRIFAITANEFTAHSTYMHFKRQGFELQKFIETKYMKEMLSYNAEV